MIAEASGYIKSNRDIPVRLKFTLGQASCQFWTCDLSYEYVSSMRNTRHNLTFASLVISHFPNFPSHIRTRDPPLPLIARMDAYGFIDLENVNRWYGDFQALRGRKLSHLEPGRIGLLGPNGAGKSSLTQDIDGSAAVLQRLRSGLGHELFREDNAGVGRRQKQFTQDLFAANSRFAPIDRLHARSGRVVPGCMAPNTSLGRRALRHGAAGKRSDGHTRFSPTWGWRRRLSPARGILDRHETADQVGRRPRARSARFALR